MGAALRHRPTACKDPQSNLRSNASIAALRDNAAAAYRAACRASRAASRAGNCPIQEGMCSGYVLTHSVALMRKILFIRHSKDDKASLATCVGFGDDRFTTYRTHP